MKAAGMSLSGIRGWTKSPTLRRLVACLFGGFVLALMVGNQEGSQNDFGVSFRHATSPLRLVTFLAIGAAAFLVLTFSSLLVRYVRLPGAVAVGTGFAVVFAGMTLTRWYDPIGKFTAVA